MHETVSLVDAQQLAPVAQLVRALHRNRRAAGSCQRAYSIVIGICVRKFRRSEKNPSTVSRVERDAQKISIFNH